MPILKQDTRRTFLCLIGEKGKVPLDVFHRQIVRRVAEATSKSALAGTHEIEDSIQREHKAGKNAAEPPPN